MTIETYNEPYAPKRLAWMAIDADTYDGAGPIGVGATEEEAKADLIEQLESHA